jgi:hypothetical protein
VIQSEKRDDPCGHPERQLRIRGHQSAEQQKPQG